ncbi:MAG: ABC transporter permease [Planctomycetota bacterium]
MVFHLLETQLRRLRHNRIELAMIFIVPIAFFSIFALIFGGGVGAGKTPKVRSILIDEVQTDFSRHIAEGIREDPSLRFHGSVSDVQDQEHARQAVRQGTATIAIVIKNASNDSDLGFEIDLLADSSDQVASQVVHALVSRQVSIARAKQAQSRREAPRSIPQVRAAAFERNADSQKGSSLLAERGVLGIVDPVSVVDVLGEGKSNPVISMYAAGIAVMFLLFGASGGGAALLEEREQKTLDRMLATQVNMDHLLLSKWFYLTVLGFVQVLVMFAFAQFAFGVDLLGHIGPFTVLTLVTSAASAALGLMMATICRSRGQLHGLSVILILTMSALGGSMVPRYVMGESLQKAGLWTFNAWALDGYNKIFWRELPLEMLLPQLGVLCISGMVFLIIARLMAIRWQVQ